MIDYAILSWLIWLPIAGGAALLAMDAMGNNACRQVALVVSIVTFALSTQLYTHFDSTTAIMQFQENVPSVSYTHLTLPTKEDECGAGGGAVRE